MKLALTPAHRSDPLARVLDGLEGDRALLRQAAATGAVFNFTHGRNIHAVQGRIYSDIRDVPGAIFERAEPAYVEDGTRSRIVPAHTPRITQNGLIIEPWRSNLARGSALPDNAAYWPPHTQQNGLTLTRVGTGVDNGLPYADIRFQGQATASFVDTAYISAQSRTATAPGQSYTASLYARQIAGSFAGVQGLRVGVIGEDDRQDFIGGSYSPQTDLTERQRLVATRRINAPYVRCAVILSLTSNTVIDVTYRLSGLQLESGMAASSAFPSDTIVRQCSPDRLMFGSLPSLGLPDTNAPFTILSDWSLIYSRTTYPWVWSLTNGPSEELGVFVDSQSRRVWDKVTTAGEVQGTIGGATLTPIASTVSHYANNDRRFYLNGVLAGSESTIDLPSTNRLHIGGNGVVGAIWALKSWILVKL